MIKTSSSTACGFDLERRDGKTVTFICLLDRWLEVIHYQDDSIAPAFMMVDDTSNVDSNVHIAKIVDTLTNEDRDYGDIYVPSNEPMTFPVNHIVSRLFVSDERGQNTTHRALYEMYLRARAAAS